MSKITVEQFSDALRAVEEGTRAWDATLQALNIPMADDKVIKTIDAAVDILAIAMHDKGLPRRLDSHNIMYHCGNDLPLVHWWCWETDFGKHHNEIWVGEQKFKIETYEHLYNLIEYVETKI